MSVVFGSTMSQMLCLINWMQLVCYLPLMTPYFPDHVKVMFSWLSFANMDIDIFTKAFKTLAKVNTENSDPFNQRFEDNDVSTMLFFDNSASILFSVLLSILGLICLVLTYLIVCITRIKIWIRLKISSYFFSNTLLFLIQGYLELLFGCTLNVMSFQASTLTEITSYFCSILCLIVCVFVMCITSAIIYDKRKILYEEDQPYIKRMGSLFVELKNDRWYQTQFYPIFLARRMFFICLIIFCTEYSEVQMNMFILTSLLVWIYQIYCKPFKEQSINLLNSINECTLFCISLIQIIFNTNIKDQSTINIAGWLVIACCLTNITINFSYSFGSLILTKIKRCFSKKVSKIEPENIMTAKPLESGDNNDNPSVSRIVGSEPQLREKPGPEF